MKLVRQQLDERGLTLVNLCCDWAALWGDNAKETEEQDAMAEKCLRAAEILGAKTIRLDAGVKESVFSDEQFETVVKKYEKYCARVAEFGASLGTENHWGATTNAVELRKLLGAVSAKNFGILLHLGNWRETEGVSKEDITDDAHIALNTEFAPRAFHTHVSFEICEQAERQLLPVDAAGYNGAWSVESHKGTNEFNNVAFQLAQVKRILTPCDYTGSEFKRTIGRP